ncbi:MAG: glycoside hydrolase family 2 protein [Ignavibacteriaceae bacterium]
MIKESYSKKYYPERFSLDGKWKFAIDSSGNYSIVNLEKYAIWRNAKVPLSWQAQFNDLRHYQGVAWYKKNIFLRQLKNNETAVIHFGAIDYLSKIFINGIAICQHEGGYVPFDFEIGKFIRPGNNEIVVRVMDPNATFEGTEGISYWNIPHGKQSWYVQTSGIWQSVWIEIQPKKFIYQVHITATIDGKFKITGKFNSIFSNKEKKNLRLKIIDPNKNIVFQTSRKISSSDTSFLINGLISSPELWSVDSPNLYTSEIIFDNKSKNVTEFGFRLIETKDKKIYLNRKPFYMIAALDQDFYPKTIYSTPSEKQLRDEMLKAKKLGLNTLRCHIKVPDPMYLKVADEVGLLIWYEIPNWDILNDNAKIRSKETLEGMLARDWNHPSLMIISLINESWGVDLQKADQRKWLKSEFDFAKEKAKGRLIVDNSACFGNFHLKTDLNDYHIYSAIPEHYKEFDESIYEINKRPKWLFSNFGDADETGKEPLIISEFGNWGLPKLPKKLPWWFSIQFGEIKPTMPAGVNNRFNEFHDNKIYSGLNQLAIESQRAQFTALKYEIEQIRLAQEIQGYVITEFTDVYWEANGLMDIWRHPKIFSKELADIQKPDVIIPRPEKYNYWKGDTAEIKIFISHYSNTSFGDAVLHWESTEGSQGEIKIPDMKRTEVRQICKIFLPVISSKNLGKIRINFEIRIKGKVVSKNYTEVFVFSCRNQKNENIGELYDPLNQMIPISKYLAENNSNSSSDKKHFLITNKIDEIVLQKLRAGEKVLCLVDSSTKLPESFPFKLINKNRDLYDGNWISTFNWMRINQEPFNGFNFGSYLGFEASDCEPEFAISNISIKNFQDVLAGMFTGWIHLNSGYVFQLKASKGKLLICTFPIVRSISSDPFSVMLFQKLISYINGEKFSPKTSLKLD